MKSKLSLKLLFLLFVFSSYSIATMRYVSKTGNSTAPYTSWETASDSIAKCLNVCYAGDTVIIGKGVYKERFNINTPITLLGISMDSCIIDGSELTTPLGRIVYSYASSTISGFTFRGINASGIYLYRIEAIDDGGIPRFIDMKKMILVK